MANYKDKVFRKVNKTKEKKRKNQEFKETLNSFLCSKDGKTNSLISWIDSNG